MTWSTRLALFSLISIVSGCAHPPAREAAAPAPTPAAPAPAPAPAEPPRPDRYVPREGPVPSIAQTYDGVFLVGAAVTPGQVLMGSTHEFIARHFNVIVAENEMKPVMLSRREGQYDFNMADQLVDWAVKNEIKVRGHTLVWHQQAAPWMFTKDGKDVSRDVLIARMRAYIHAVVGHFKGRVWAWDVVNEAFAPGEPNVETVGGWRKSDFYRIIGPEFIELAFRFAHEADPDALLFYNDYATEQPAKRALILELVRDLQKKGVPIHGVGHQTHVYLSSPPVEDLEQTIQEVAKLGLRNHVTEMDVSLRTGWGRPVEDAEDDLLFQLQAERYAKFFQMFVRNKDKIDAVLVWGLSDEHSWLRPPDAPLLFSEMQPKPAFWAVIDEGLRAKKK
ncbi:MAG TPA: endo-1,4-beta-xylanase [Anaeromyxobacter sp.]|nr:endo-1,4-beta-xylanase [Anaeromyxobacter sp.]